MNSAKLKLKRKPASEEEENSASENGYKGYKLVVTKAEQIAQMIETMGQQARQAALALSIASSDQKSQAIRNAAQCLRAEAADILAINAQEVRQSQEAGLSLAMIDRLMLDSERVESIARAIEDIADLPDPIGVVIDSWTRPNGLRIERVRTPLGVIGVIYESRPNVTADAGMLALKSGNAVILRSGSESHRTAGAIHSCLQKGLQEAGLPKQAIQFIPTTDRAAVGAILKASDWIDVIIPRGGPSLVRRVQEEARVPVFAHLEGICHLFIDKDYDPKEAIAVTVNSKMRRTGICGAMETLLIDRVVKDRIGRLLFNQLLDSGCKLRVCQELLDLDPRLELATEEDWTTEYLDAVLSVKIVDGVHEAIAHINRYGSHHTDAIVTENDRTAALFMQKVDSAIVLHNASTQFADGGEFGFGAEIGIATGRLHARGPVGVEQLTSFKYCVHGSGQTRPA